MSKNTKLALSGLIIIFVLGGMSIYGSYYIGFPDGHLTEYDRFYKQTIYPIFLIINIFFSLLFTVSIYTKKKANYIFMLYVLAIAIFFMIDYYFSISLENGQGG